MKSFITPQLLTTLDTFEQQVSICMDLNRIGRTSKPYLVFDGDDLHAVHAHEVGALGEAQGLVARKQARA